MLSRKFWFSVYLVGIISALAGHFLKINKTLGIVLFIAGIIMLVAGAILARIKA